MIYFQVKLKDDEKIIVSNLKDSHFEYENNKNFFDSKNKIRGAEKVVKNLVIWIIVENEESLLKSNKLFKKTFEIYSSAFTSFWNYYSGKIVSQAHTLDKIRGKMEQKIEGFAEKEKFHGDSYHDILDNVSNLIKNDTDSASDLICFFQKRLLDMKSHMLGFQIIHSNIEYEVSLKNVNLKKAILNLYTPFANDLNENNVNLNIYFDDDVVEVDRNLFSLVMYNIFDNAVKYTKPGSEIRINFESDHGNLDISMESLRIEREEINNLAMEGARGRHASTIAGNGVGLFVIKEALNLMDMSMSINPNYEKGDLEYTENHFKIDKFVVA